MFDLDGHVFKEANPAIVSFRIVETECFRLMGMGVSESMNAALALNKKVQTKPLLYLQICWCCDSDTASG